MISEEKLIGWLCIMRHNLDGDGEDDFYIPREVRHALVAKGWATVEIEADGRGAIRITDAGTTVSDLAAPEWGIDPVPVEADG